MSLEELTCRYAYYNIEESRIIDIDVTSENVSDVMNETKSSAESYRSRTLKSLSSLMIRSSC